MNPIVEIRIELLSSTTDKASIYECDGLPLSLDSLLNDFPVLKWSIQLTIIKETKCTLMQVMVINQTIYHSFVMFNMCRSASSAYVVDCNAPLCEFMGDEQCSVALKRVFFTTH